MLAGWVIGERGGVACCVVLRGVGIGGVLVRGSGTQFGCLGGSLVGPSLSGELVKYRGLSLRGATPLLRRPLRSLWVWCRFLNGKDLGMDDFCAPSTGWADPFHDLVTDERGGGRGSWRL